MIAADYKWASTRETCLRRFVNNKGAEQPAHPRRLISAFIIRVLKRIMSKLAQAKFFGNPEDRFCRVEAQTM